MPSIFHIVSDSDWHAACEVGRYAPESLAREGFVHFSYADQVAGTANSRYADRDGLIVVEFDPAKLAEPVVEEDLYDAGELFPHVYAAIDTGAALAEHPLRRDADGSFSFLA